MKIIEDKRSKTGWVTAVIEGRWVQAKVYNEPSKLGVNDGRVSKLAICKTDKRNPHKNFFDQMDYNYDRGLDFDSLPDGLLLKILETLESL